MTAAGAHVLDFGQTQKTKKKKVVAEFHEGQLFVVEKTPRKEFSEYENLTPSSLQSTIIYAVGENEIKFLLNSFKMIGPGTSH